LGARTAEQITDNLGCLDFTLSDEYLTRLNEISEMNLGFPHDFLASDGARRLVYGSTIDRLDNHRGEGR